MKYNTPPSLRHLLLLPLALAALLAGCGPSSDQADTQPDPALVDAVIQQLQDSGKLDDAVEQSLQNLVKKRREAQVNARKQHLQDLQKQASKMPAPDLDQEHVLGNADAEVSLIEYSDFECPFCKRYHGTPQEVQKAFGDQTNLIYRSMPLPFHGQAAVLEARAGECAARLGGNQVFWKYSNDLFHYSQSNGKGLGDDQTIYTLADKYDLNQKKFKACLDDPAIQDRIDANLQSAKKLGITGTPTTIIRNNKTDATKVVVGARSADKLKEAVRDVLGKDDN